MDDVKLLKLGGDSSPSVSDVDDKEYDNGIVICAMSRQEYFGYCIQATLDALYYSYFATLVDAFPEKFTEISEEIKEVFREKDDPFEVLYDAVTDNNCLWNCWHREGNDYHFNFKDRGKHRFEDDYLGLCQGLGLGLRFPKSPCHDTCWVVEQNVKRYFNLPNYTDEMRVQLQELFPKKYAYMNWDGEMEDGSIEFFTWVWGSLEYKAVHTACALFEKFSEIVSEIKEYLPKNERLLSRDYNKYVAPYVKFLNGWYCCDGFGCFNAKDGVTSPL